MAVMRFFLLILVAGLASFGITFFVMGPVNRIADVAVATQAEVVSQRSRKPPTKADPRLEEERRARLRSESERDQDFNALRRATFRAADTYAAGPCSPGAKQAFVDNVTAYLDAVVKKMKPSGPESLKGIATALDMQVVGAIEKAVDRGGISGADFPGGFAGEAIRFPQRPDPKCGRTAAGN